MTLDQAERFREQEVKDAAAWHAARSPNLTPRDITAFYAGFNDGYRKALAAVKMHGAPQ